MGEFKQRIGCEVTWDFLAPNRAHNRCDSAFAHWKRAIDKLIRNHFRLSSISHLAFAAANLKNCYYVEVTEFPNVIDAKQVDESFMRDAFRFEYAAPEMRTKKCGHACYMKGCNHGACCNVLQRRDVVCFLF